MRNTILAASCILMAGCSYIPGTDANIEKRGLAALNEIIFDPESIRTKDLKVAKVSGTNIPEAYRGKALCGQINAKTSNGGYVGFSPFIVMPSKDDDTFSGYVQSILQPGPYAPVKGAKKTRCESAKAVAEWGIEVDVEGICKLEQDEIEKAKQLDDFVHLWNTYCDAT